MDKEIKEKLPRWMVIQLDQAMWGEGETRDEALRDAVSWMDDVDSIDELEAQLVNECANNFSGDLIVTENKKLIAEYS